MRTLLIRFALCVTAMSLVPSGSRAQWKQANGPNTYPAFSLAVESPYLFVGTNAGVLRYTINNLNYIDTCLKSRSAFALLADGSNLFAGTSGGEAFRSSNDGAEWTSISLGRPPFSDFRAFAAIHSEGISYLFAGTRSGTGNEGVLRSATNGSTWETMNSGLTDTSVYALAVSGTTLFAGTNGGGVFLSSNYGANWTAANNGLSNNFVNALVVSGSNLFAGTDEGGVFLSTNHGISWEAANNGITNPIINVLGAKGTNLFAGTVGGVFLSTDDGANWAPVNDGLNIYYIFSLAVDDVNLYAGTGGGGLWYRPLSEMITDVKENMILPTDYSLNQNYPNPFNPSTTIRYSIPKTSVVTIKVYDALGREFATLVNEENKMGTYEAKFDGSNLSTGVYFYRIQAGIFIQTKKMMLLR
jgi:hypothetical protein